MSAYDKLPEEWKNFDPWKAAKEMFEGLEKREALDAMDPSKMWYMLDETGNVPVPAPFMKAMMWKQENKKKCIVGRFKLGEMEIMTDFLGWNEGIAFRKTKANPLVWETMIFGGPHHGIQDRCGGTREQALAMHEAMVAWLKAHPTKDER